MKLRHRSTEKQSGIALLIVLVALLLASAIAMGMMFATNTETAINGNYRDTQRAYFAARAGIEEVRQRLQPGTTNAITAPAGPPSLTAANVIYVTNPTGSETVDPTASGSYNDDELCHEQFSGLTCTTLPTGTAWVAPYVASVAPGTGQTSALPYKWVRITTKQNQSSAPYQVDSTKVSSGQVCWDGAHEAVAVAPSTCANAFAMQANPVWVLTSLAVTPGNSRRMVQTEVALNPPVVTNATVDSQAAVTLQGQLTVNSYDNCTCNMSTSPPSGTGCDKSKYAIVTAGSITTNGSASTITSGQTGGSPAGTQASAPWPYDINSLINTYKNMPNVATPFGTNPTACSSTCQVSGSAYGAVSSNFTPLTPSAMSPQITYIPGNTQLTSNVTGSGILVIDGDLNIHGGFQFYGLVLVKGSIDFTGGGSDTVNLYGAFLNGKNTTAQNDVLGGSVVLQYDSCALKVMNQHQPPPIVLASHEMTF